MKIIKDLFTRTKVTRKRTEDELSAAQQLVAQYAQFLETSAPMPGRVADVKLLPFSKQAIKDAMAMCINGLQDDVLTEHLSYGYLMLSAWQDGVGDESPGVDFSALDLDSDPLELAAQIQGGADQMKNWTAKVEQEQLELLAELNALGVRSDRTASYG